MSFQTAYKKSMFKMKKLVITVCLIKQLILNMNLSKTCFPYFQYHLTLIISNPFFTSAGAAILPQKQLLQINF